MHNTLGCAVYHYPSCTNLVSTKRGLNLDLPQPKHIEQFDRLKNPSVLILPSGAQNLTAQEIGQYHLQSCDTRKCDLYTRVVYRNG